MKDIPGIQKESDVKYEDLRHLGDARSVTLDVIRREHAPFDVVNVDLCDYVASDEPASIDAMYSVLQNLFSVQDRAANEWVLLLTTRVDMQNTNDSTFALLNSLVTDILVRCPDVRAELEAVLGPGAQGLAGATGEPVYSVAVAIGLAFWLEALARGGGSVATLSSVFAYQVHNGHPDCDMYSFAIRVRPGLRPQRDPSGLGVTAKLEELACSDAAYTVQQIGQKENVDETLRRDPQLVAELSEATWVLLEPLGYERSEFDTFVLDGAQQP